MLKRSNQEPSFKCVQRHNQSAYFGFQCTDPFALSAHSPPVILHSVFGEMRTNMKDFNNVLPSPPTHHLRFSCQLLEGRAPTVGGRNKHDLANRCFQEIKFSHPFEDPLSKIMYQSPSSVGAIFCRVGKCWCSNFGRGILKWGELLATWNILASYMLAMTVCTSDI